MKIDVEGTKDILQEQLGESIAKQGPLRVASQPTTGGMKRQRVASAASKAIDNEDEPRSSPTLRKTSMGKQEGVETERKVLGAIENV